MFPPQPKFVFDDPTAFHTRNHMLNPDADARQPSVLGLVLGRQFPTTRLFRRLLDSDACNGEALKAQVLV